MEKIIQAQLFHRTQYEAQKHKIHLQKNKQLSLNNARKFFNITLQNNTTK